MFRIHTSDMKNTLLPLIISSIFVLSVFLFFNNLENYFIQLLQSFMAKPEMYATLSFMLLTADIILPVPSSIVMYLNGYVTGIIFGTLLSFFSLLAGSIVGYYIGRFTSGSLKSTSEKQAGMILSEYGVAAILMTRGIPVLSEALCIVCGYNRMPLKKYFIYNAIGFMPLCFLYGICGSIGYDKNLFLLTFICSFFISAGFWIFGKKYFQKTNE